MTFRSILRSIKQSGVAIQPREALERRYYLRFTVADKPHVLADITDVLGRNEISISSVRQDESCAVDNTARLIIITHNTTEGRLAEAAEHLSKLACIQGSSIRLPISP